MADYIPAADQDCKAMLVNLAAYAVAHAVALGVPATLAATLSEDTTTFTDALETHGQAQDAARAARQAKDFSRAAAVQAAREVAQIVQNNPNVSDEQRAAMGLPIRDHVKTPVPIPTVLPGVAAEPSLGLQQPVRVFDLAFPNRRAKPPGTTGWQILVRVAADAPTDPTQCYVAGTATRGRFTVPFTGSDAGKKAWITARAVNGKGEAGPLAEPIEVAIAA